jgi:hypothetical protein
MDASGLQCVVCPTQPTFSDVSHLLTHLLSKAHAAYRYKLDLRKDRGDPDATAILTAYDDWYRVNKLGQLLAERESAKIDRKNKRRSSGQNASIQNIVTPPVLADPAVTTATAAGTVDGTLAVLTPAPRVTVVAPTVATPALPDYIDPRLGGSYGAFKKPFNTEGASLIPSIVESTTSETNGGNSSGLDDKCDVNAPGNTELDPWDGQNEILNDDLPVTPKPLRTRKNPKTNSSSLSTGGAIDSFDDNHSASVDDKEAANNNRSEEAIRLKGVLWPGMDLFDAATPEMRRKRNQKKDRTILKQMETTSQQVEPTEQVFSLTVEWLADREITGRVEDYSPLKGETPIAKGLLRGKPGMLRERDANIPRAGDRKRVKTGNPRNRDESEDTLEATEPDRFIYHQGNFGAAYDEKDQDLRLSMSTLEGKPRKRLTVFKDEPDQDKQAKGNLEAPRGTLAPAQLVLNNTSNISHNHGHRIPLGNENIEPILNIRCRNDPPIYNPTSPFVNGADGEVFNQRYFYDDSTTGLGLGDGQDQYGYQFNPLLGGTWKTSMYGHPYGEEATLTNSGWTTNSQAMASDAGFDHQFTWMHLNTNPEH